MLNNVTSSLIYRGHKSDYYYFWRIYEKPSNPTPLEILIVKMDKVCPRCPKPARIDIGYDNGIIFGAKCFTCGWSF